MKGNAPANTTLAFTQIIAPSSNVEIGLSANIYLDAETALEMGNLLTALAEYGSAETAKFITGARPLSELDEYFDEMEKLGALDYVKVYQECYDAMK